MTPGVGLSQMKRDYIVTDKPVFHKSCVLQNSSAQNECPKIGSIVILSAVKLSQNLYKKCFITRKFRAIRIDALFQFNGKKKNRFILMCAVSLLTAHFLIQIFGFKLLRFCAKRNALTA